MMRRYGQTWDHWEDHLTIPMLAALEQDRLRHPSVDDLTAWRFKYRPPASALRHQAPPPKLMGHPEYEP